MANTYSPTRKVKQISYSDYEYNRLNMIQDKLMEHHAMSFSQLVKNLMRKEYQLLSL